MSLAVADASYYWYSENFDATKIPENATSIDVNGVPVNILTTGMFVNLTRCRYLSFHRTNISEIQPRAWMGLDQLRRLTLRKNELFVLTAECSNT